MSTGPHEIIKITLDIWDGNLCGSNYGPYIEIASFSNKYRIGIKKRHTYFHGPFSSGTTLIWDNNGENRYGGKNLGGVSGFQVTPFYRSRSFYPRPYAPVHHYIKYRIVGGGGDDFCPNVLTIFTKDGTVYKSGPMKDWVDDKKGNGWRTAPTCPQESQYCESQYF